MSYETLSAAKQSLQAYLIDAGAALPGEVRDRLIATSAEMNAGDCIARSAEALYAARADLDNAGRLVCAGLAQLASQHGFHGLSERGWLIAQVMRRDAGVPAPNGQSWPDESADPEPHPEFAKVDLVFPISMPV